MSKADKDGWIRHRGGRCPVKAGVMVDVKWRDGREHSGMIATGGPSEGFWKHDCYHAPSEIMRYRVCEPVASNARPVESLSLSPECQTVGRSDRINPLQWRDRIAEIDATTQALTAERAELVQKLASEGFALIGRVVESVEDMSDWRNWKVGDLIEMVREKSWADMTDGRLYQLLKAGVDGFSFADDVDEVRECFKRTAVDYAKDFKWHSRPSA